MSPKPEYVVNVKGMENGKEITEITYYVISEHRTSNCALPPNSIKGIRQFSPCSHAALTMQGSFEALGSHFRRPDLYHLLQKDPRRHLQRGLPVLLPRDLEKRPGRVRVREKVRAQCDNLVFRLSRYGFLFIVSRGVRFSRGKIARVWSTTGPIE